MRRLVFLLLALALTHSTARAETPAPAPRTALVMFELAGCPHCQRFLAEIGPIYPKTAEGRRAPLVRVDMSRPRPAEFAFVEFVVFSPTFVLVHDGREIGRIVGYGGDESFWSQLGVLVGKLPPEAARAGPARAALDFAPPRPHLPLPFPAPIAARTGDTTP
jgi:hypothetical protein